MFIGEYSHTIDEKGRVSLPKKFRAKFASGLVVTRGLDQCLWVFATNEWAEMAEKISSLPVTQKNARSFSRLMLAGAMDLELDRTGRINLPGYLKDYAGIDKKVTVCGMYNRLEIWPAKSWEDFKNKMEDESEEVAENLSEIGF